MVRRLNQPPLSTSQDSDEYRAQFDRIEYDRAGGVDVFALNHVSSSLKSDAWKSLSHEFELEFGSNGTASLYVPHRYYLQRMPTVRTDLTCLVEIVFSVFAIALLSYLTYLFVRSAEPLDSGES